MKKFLSISFLLLYLFSTTEFSQLLKLQVLVEHFGDHKKEDPTISIFDFLILHYSSHHNENHPHNEDYEKDQQLPFIVHTDVMNVLFVPLQTISFEVVYKHFSGSAIKKLTFNDTCFENNYLSAIWQPPKYA